MAKLVETPIDSNPELSRESPSFADRPIADATLEDLIYSWQRLRHPALRRLAVRLIRTLEEDRGSNGFAVR